MYQKMQRRGLNILIEQEVCTNQVTPTCPTPGTISKARVIRRQLKLWRQSDYLSVASTPVSASFCFIMPGID
jgi:hypothetical protein